MNPRDTIKEFPATAEFRATAVAVLSGFREARSVLDVYINVLEYFEDQLADDVVDRPPAPPPKVDPALARKAKQVQTMMSMFGKLAARGH